MNDNWIQKSQEALQNASWVNISWLNIARFLPMKVYDNIFYPYSHHTIDDAELLTISFLSFHYRKGSSLHQLKGRDMHLQETEELVVFNSNVKGRIVMIKNMRSHLAFAMRPVPRSEAERIGILEHDRVDADAKDYRPGIEKIGKRGAYKSYA